jgi:hypothetical protein
MYAFIELLIMFHLLSEREKNIGWLVGWLEMGALLSTWSRSTGLL